MNPEPAFLESHARGVILRLRVVPRASRNEVGEILGDSLKVRLTAPPVEGKANRALLKFLGKHLGLPSSRLELLSGQGSRSKRVLVTGATMGWMAERFDIPTHGMR